MRLFIAIRLSDEVKKAILGTMHDLKAKGIKGSYTAGGNLHLTLAFIGETRDKGEIIKAMDRVAFTPFKLSVRELGTFGDILWAGVKGNQGLKGLARDVRAQLDAAGIQYDRKEFVPHITLVRRMGGTLPKGFPGPKADMMVSGISLMKSENRNGKTVYTEIYKVGK